MKTALIVAALVVALVVAWLFGGRLLVLFIDGFATDGDAAPTAGPFVYSTGFLDVGKTPLEISTSNGRPTDVRIGADATGRVALQAGGETFILGTRTAAVDASTWPDLPFAPDPGDDVSFRVAHSVFAWPTPFDLNFITGNSPSWKRNVYYTLTWHKRDGATLELTWRYEQWFYDDWGSPMMTREGGTGLIRARISRGSSRRS